MQARTGARIGAAVRYRRVLYHWTRATGRTLTDAEREEFYGRPQVKELAAFPEAVLRDSARAAATDGADGRRLKLDAWLAAGRAEQNRRMTLTTTGRRAASPARSETRHSRPADADLHRRVAEILGDTGRDRLDR